MLINAGMQWSAKYEVGTPQYQVVPPNTWYTVRYNHELADPGGSWLDLSDGVFRPDVSRNPGEMKAFVHYLDPNLPPASPLPPAGQIVRVIATRMRLCRDPHGQYGEPDTTCTTEWAGTPGTITNGGYAWHFKVRPTEPVGLQVLVQTEMCELLTVDTSGGPRQMLFKIEEAAPPSLQITGAEFKFTYAD